MVTLNYDVDYSAIAKTLRNPSTKNREIIEEFINSGRPIVELLWEGNYKGVDSAQNSFYQSILRMKRNKTIKAVVRGKRLFLLNTEKVDALNG